MGMMNIDEEQLLRYLLKFVTGMLVDCDQIRFVDLYGKEKPSQLFETTTTDRHHVFTQLKKKKGNGKNFNRGIVGGGGSWKGIDNGKPVYNQKGLKIGFKKTFRFDEENHVWIMKEYRPSDNILKALRLRGQIRHEEEFAVCSITRSVYSSKVIIPSDNNVENFIDSVLISSSQCQEAQNQFQELGQSFAQYQFQDLEQLSSTNGIPSDGSNSILNGNVGPVTLVFKESNVSAAKEDECSVHQQTPSVECSVYDIATYHKELDAYAAFQLKSVVTNIPQQQEDDEPDSIPLFHEDFNIDYTHLLT
ncbi:NAC domain-containing protein 26-like [Solanum lycopersicum]|uniref:NAC domain-containing protein 26-like n=1 Tax=Solanum lycopersicum TaxID=4081 RepID=UPI003748142B